MALLIKCPNCQKDVSGMVSRCPFCNTDLTHVHNYNSGRQDNVYFNPDSGPAIHYPDFSKRPEPGYTQPRFETGTFPEQPAAEAEETKKAEEADKPAAPSARKRRKSPPAGRKLLGYRSGNLLYMLFSVFYHMAACVGILYAFSLSSQYAADGTLIFHLCRVILAAIMLFLPVLLLSENKLRRKFPLIRSRKPAVLATGLLIIYIPLAALFFTACRFCIQ